MAGHQALKGKQRKNVVTSLFPTQHLNHDYNHQHIWYQ